MLLYFPDLGEKGQKEALDEARNLLTSNGAEITHEDIWGLRDLAYRIKKQDQGYYAVLNFNLEKGENLPEIVESLNLDQSIIRHLLIKTPKNYQLTTLAEYQAAAAEEEAEEEKKQAEKRKSSPKPKKKEVKKEKPKSSPKKEDQSEKSEKKEESKGKLEEVDKKLKSIINDPDISI